MRRRGDCPPQAQQLDRDAMARNTRSHRAGVVVAVSEQAVEPATDIALGDVAAAHDQAQ
jgi:hypothetical protein